VGLICGEWGAGPLLARPLSAVRVAGRGGPASWLAFRAGCRSVECSPAAASSSPSSSVSSSVFSSPSSSSSASSGSSGWAAPRALFGRFVFWLFARLRQKRVGQICAEQQQVGAHSARKAQVKVQVVVHRVELPVAQKVE
jgi:hypothetical protein